MKEVEITYNPYTITTEITVAGKMPKPNSSLHFGKLRLQEWAGNLPDILIDEYFDTNFEIIFKGTQADFDDLKIAFESQHGKVSAAFNHHRTPDVADVEANVDAIFEEIMKGPVDALRDKSIIVAFEKAKNQEFEINVVATMSAGKSTLINALLDKKLMPAANKPTTATIVKITDTDQDNYSATAYDMSGKEVLREDNICYDDMKLWNKNDKVSIIEINGRIPCVNSVGMKLVLIDTPGPNNSRDERHKAMTYEMFSDSDKSLVLFTMNAGQLDVDDEKVFLDYVCDCMKSGGKQSRERFIFAVNQMDRFDPKEESVEDALKGIADGLEKRQIYEPNIFPVSALAALELRTQDDGPQALDAFKRNIQKFESHHFDSYYHFSHLPHVVRLKLENFLKEANADTKIEIHSGIVSIEEAISQYINKYARTIKVYDLVQSFNNRLKELAAIATIQEEIRQNSDKKKELDIAIKAIEKKIQSGQSAQVLTTMIDKIDLGKDVETEVKEYTDSLFKKINGIIASYDNSSKVLKSKAEEQVAEIQKESDAILNQIEVRINTILNNTFVRFYKIIVDEYKSYIEDLGIDFRDAELGINPLSFVAEDLADLPSILAEKTQMEDEGEFRTGTITESYQVKKTNSFFTPWRWGSNRYETRYRYKTVKTWVANYVDYVNMSEVVSSYFEPVLLQLSDAKKESLKHVKTETNRIKRLLRETLLEVNQVLNKKLEELQLSIADSNNTAEEIKRQKANLKWMQGIIGRVNELINF